ncbi:MAG TPA: phosphatase PAP2 family protein [Parafilimonas sp.]|jgi:hypothetical protein
MIDYLKFFLLLLLITQHTNAQFADGAIKNYLHKKNNQKVFSFRSLYFPVASIALGSFSNDNNSIINNDAIKIERNEDMPHFKTHIDDYMQYAPIFAGYACIASGSKTNTWLYTKEIFLNEMIMNASVYSVKHLSKVPSIVDGSYNAFPSGHTAQAFSSATLFNDNFAKGKLWLQCLSYGSASAVGVLRILNNRHWTSDTVAGAGFGILSAKISEWILVPHYNKKYYSTIY